MTSPPPNQRLWRVFPWDKGAARGAPFSPAFVPPGQGSGRFDLDGRPPVLYLAESPVHAVGERIQRFRGQTLATPDLREFGRPLAVVSLDPDQHVVPVADLCDPMELTRYACRPDELMSRDLSRTQAISRKLHGFGLAGFRVWSALTGDWHSTILYLDRVSLETDVVFCPPMELDLDSEPVREAARLLAIPLDR